MFYQKRFAATRDAPVLTIAVGSLVGEDVGSAVVGEAVGPLEGS